jgi:hypothetical protein
VEETRVPRENHQPVVSHWQTLLHDVVLSTSINDEIKSLPFNIYNTSKEQKMKNCTHKMRAS